MMPEYPGHVDALLLSSRTSWNGQRGSSRSERRAARARTAARSQATVKEREGETPTMLLLLKMARKMGWSSMDPTTMQRLERRARRSRRRQHWMTRLIHEGSMLDRRVIQADLDAPLQQEINEKARELVRLAICTEGGRRTLKREDINKKGQSRATEIWVRVELTLIDPVSPSLLAPSKRVDIHLHLAYLLELTTGCSSFSSTSSTVPFGFSCNPSWHPCGPSIDFTALHTPSNRLGPPAILIFIVLVPSDRTYLPQPFIASLHIPTSPPGQFSKVEMLKLLPKSWQKPTPISRGCSGWNSSL